MSFIMQMIQKVIDYEDIEGVRETARYAVNIHRETGMSIEEITQFEFNLTDSERRLVNREATRQLNRE